MSRAANTIILEDDEDDVRVFSPHSQWSALQVSSNAYSRPLHIPVLDDDDLELRLGPSGNMPAAPRSEPIVKRMRPESAVCLSISNFQDPFFFGPMVDLTIANNNLDGNHSIAAKRKRCLPPPEAPRELKLTCAICMDTMEEETSTICGHIFCRKCIMEAIKMQKKCPTCRKRLVSSQTHRIYLS